MARPLKNGQVLADPVGAPDFTLPVSILAQVIESLKVDITAQSIPTLNINIASISQGVTVTTTVSNMPSTFPLPSDQISALQQVTIQNVAAGLVLNVNIAQVTATLNIANFPSTYPLPSDQVDTLKQITIQNVSTGLLIPIDIKQVTATLNIANFPSTYPLPDAQVSALQQVTIQNVAAGLYIPINIAQANATVNTNATISGVVAGVYVPITIHSVESGVVFNVNITNVQSGVVFNVNVTGTPTVNIQTSGGANIVIDKLTQGAYTERRDVMANNGATATMVASNLTNKRGKFFPRGCRGFLRYIEIYCDNTDSVSHTFTVKIAPMPGMGAVYTGTVSVAAGSSAAWRMVQFNKYWNYDSMFIWVICDSDSYGRLGYDTGEPHDCYMSTDEVSWLFYDYRFWFRIAPSGMTVGDLPVSGTVNTIVVPNLASGRQATGVTVPAGGAYYEEVKGAGSLLIAYFYYYTAASTTVLRPSILCDGVEALPMDGTIANWRDYLVGLSNSDIYIGQWDTTNNRYTLVVALPLKFRRSLQVGFKNGSASAYGAGLYFTYELIG